MAAEKKEVLIDVTVNRQEALNALEDVNEQLAANKQSLRDLNKEFEKGEIDVKEYTKESTKLALEQKELASTQRSLVKEVQAESNSINGLRTRLAALTKERNGLNTGTAEGAKRFRQLQTEIKGTNDRLKELEQEGGDFRRNVGNYTDAFKNFTVTLGGVPVSLNNINQAGKTLQEGLGGAANATGGLTKAFFALGAVPIITIIAGIVTILSSLYAAVKRNDDAATAFEGIMEGLSRVLDLVLSPLVEIGTAILQFATGTDKAGEGVRSLGDILLDFGQSILDNIINRFKSFLVLGDAIVDLAKGEFDSAITKMNDSVIMFGTGIADGTEKLNKFQKGIALSMQQGIEFAAAMDDANDTIRENSIEISENNIAITKGLKASQDISKSLKERLQILDEVSTLESRNLELELQGAVKRAKALSDRNKQRKNITDAERQEEVDAIVEVNNLREKSLGLQEKILVRRNKLIEKQLEEQAKIEKAAEDKFLKALQDREKSIEENAQAQLEIAEKNAKAENDLELLKLQQRIDYDNLLLENTELTANERIALLTQKNQEEIDLINEKREQLLENESLAEQERVLINEQADYEIVQSNQRAQKEITSINEKAADKQKKIEQDKQAFIASAVSGALGAIATAAQGNAELQKGIAFAQTGIDTYFAAQKAYSSQLAIPSPDAPVRAAIAAGVAIAQGLARAAAIASTPAFAGGGDFVTKGPQMIMVGDNPGGMERVTVTPISGKGVTSYNKAHNLIKLAGGGTVTAGTGSLRSAVTDNIDNASSIADATANIIKSMPAPEVSVKEFTKVSKRVQVKEKSSSL